jgi:hypothetical protein
LAVDVPGRRRPSDYRARGVECGNRVGHGRRQGSLSRDVGLGVGGQCRDVGKCGGDLFTGVIDLHGGQGAAGAAGAPQFERETGRPRGGLAFALGLLELSRNTIPDRGARTKEKAEASHDHQRDDGPA